MTTLLAKFPGPLENLTVWTLSYNGENMDSCEVPHATDDRWSIGSQVEMEHQLNALRSLVCDLLKTNEELRRALMETRPDVSNKDV